MLLSAAPLILLIRKDRRAALLLGMFGAQLAYSVYVGGDAWEYWGGSNRYISIAMPAFFVALSASLFIVGESIVNGMNLQSAATRSLAKALVFLLLIAVTIISAARLFTPAPATRITRKSKKLSRSARSRPAMPRLR